MSDTPRIAIVQFPGSNCERETAMAVERSGMVAEQVLWNNPVDLGQFDGFVIIGGFSYEDRCRSGLIASKDPLMDRVAEQAAAGKPVLGICNGAQILVESGLVPGLANRQLGAALAVNKRMQGEHVAGTGYYNTWIHMRPSHEQPNSVFGRQFVQPIHIPIAHAEGRFIVPGSVLTALRDAGATLWQYCDADGVVTDAFPVNPNGSVDNLAAISNAAGNVLAMMPHPERTANGDVIFQSMAEFIRSGDNVTVAPLKAALPASEIALYQPGECVHECKVKMVIHDNAAVSVQQALRQLGLDVDVHRYVHWEVASDSSWQELQQPLIDSYELLNSSKEYLVDDIAEINSVAYLVRDHDDTVGRYKLEVLHHQCGLSQVQALQHGVIWQVVAREGQSIDAVDQVLRERHILFNPFAHQVYQYQ